MIEINNLKHIQLKKFINPRTFRGFFRFRLLHLFFAACIGLISCTEMDEMGLDLVEDRLGVGSTDTLSIIAYSILEDSVVTSYSSSNPTARQLLGMYNDPLFGKTRASIYTETRLLSVGNRIAPTVERSQLKLDSVVVMLAYNGYFGDTLSPQTIKVYELDENIPEGVIYSNRELSIKPTVLNQQWNPETRYYFAPRDSVFLGPDSLRVIAHMRLRLNDEFGQRFIDATETDFESIASYLNFFKGLKITAEETSGQGAIAYFNLGSALSSMLVYYSIIGDTVFTRSRIAEFPINEFSRRYTHFDNFNHDFSSPLIRAQVIDGDTLQGQNNVFAQSMANYKVKLQIPHITELFRDKQNNVVINSAQLILPRDESLIDDKAGYTSGLFLISSNNENPFLRDFLVNAGYFGGGYDSRKGYYLFNLTQHVQAIIRGEIPNSSLYLMVTGSAENASRVVLSGTQSDNPIRLEIKYTEPIQ
jgi:hypothetical protein